VECSAGCGWAAVTTNQNTPMFDRQRYDVFLLTDLPQGVAASRAGVALGRPARDLRAAASGSQALVAGVDALGVLHIARLLARRGMSVTVVPEFRWPLPRPGEAS
jgi:hypothetical protein